MSENATSDVARKPPKKPKLERGYKLPTPPPDPWEAVPSTCRSSQTNKSESVEDGNEKDKEKEREVLDYIELLHKRLYSRSCSTFGPAVVTEEAFDHLEKLYKLMEQMLELREQNVRFHRRIRDLEHLNNLERIHINPAAVEEEYPDLEKDTVFAEALLESILQDPKNKDLSRPKTRSSLLRRHRSVSATERPNLIEAARDEVGEKDDAMKKDKQSKVSKWTKVKAAFRWEKASNVGDTKSQDSGIHVPVNYEIARYLRVPSTSDEMGHSAGDSGAGISTPGSISSASSNDDFQRIGRTACEDARSSDDENPNQYIPHPKEYRHKSQIHKSQLRNPWAKMKDIIHHPRSSLKKKHRLSAASDDIQIDVEFCSDNEDVFESDDPISKSTHLSLSPSPNVCSTPSTSPCCSDIPPEVVERYQRVLAEDSTSDSETKSSRWVRVRRAFLTKDRNRTPKSSQSSQNKDRPDDGNIEEEIKKNYAKLQKKISLEFQDKLSEWERLKQKSPGASTPTSTGPLCDENKDPAFAKKMEEWQKIKSQSTSSRQRLSQVTRETDLPPEFKKKLEEWEKIKKTSAGPKKKLGEVPRWKSLGGPSESETIAVPKIRRSESTQAQINYDLMEGIVKLLTELQVTEDEIRCLVENKNLEENQNKRTYKFLNELQRQSIKKLMDKLLQLQEANHAVIDKMAENEEKPSQANTEANLEALKVVSTTMIQVVDRMDKTTSARLQSSDITYPATLFENIKEIRTKIAELRRCLCCICSNNEANKLSRKSSVEHKVVKKTCSNESKETEDSQVASPRKNSEKGGRFQKMESASGQVNISASQGAVKKRIRRQKTLQKSFMDTDDEEAEVHSVVRQHKKLTRTRSISDGNLPPIFDQNLLSPSTPYPETSTSESRLDSSPSESAVTLFVKTTRKLFTPLVETSLAKTASEPINTDQHKDDEKKPVDKIPTEEKVVVPESPTPQRKVYKEVSPSIKLMMAKFNQSAKQAENVKSGGSSGSTSPAWISPVSERRVKAQTEKYQEEIRKMSPLLGGRNEVEKSSSTTVLTNAGKQVTIPARKTSLNAVTSSGHNSSTLEDITALKKSLTLDISLANQNPRPTSFSAETRMRKIQQAKEEFLRTPVSAPSFISEEALQYPSRNRLSQVSVESESSCEQGSLPGALIKSASAGMINIDPDVYKRINPEYRAEGYVSLPRQRKKSKDGFLPAKSAFSSIASKFRKVKMRRGKDKDKDKDQPRQAVATLCRQSLVVDISPSDPPGDDFNAVANDVTNNGDVRRSSKDSKDETAATSSVTKSNSWIRRSLFKK
ncbi:uncharacterized protein LOC143196635 isoform X5 [Rhynchophorus ferrugineus]|uniref:uncharacterized protein LOC143196635 isoform X5 n=1 Tax=Rhynchophorus ferrugineus TaxID=354439 RepID=UPI003FCD7958